MAPSPRASAMKGYRATIPSKRLATTVADGFGAADQSLLLERLDGAERRRARDRVAPERPAQAARRGRP